MTHAARTLAPEYIICDEIGTEEEVRAMSYALGTGVKLIVTVHAGLPGGVPGEKDHPGADRCGIIRLVRTAGFGQKSL